VVALAVTAALFLLPGCIKKKAIAAAAEQGIALSIDDVTLGLTKVVLVGVKASSAEVPEVKGQASRVVVELSGLTPRRFSWVGGEIAIQGPHEQASRSLDAYRARHPSKGGDVPFAFESVHLVWDQAFKKTKVDVLELRGDARMDELHVSSPSVTLEIENATLGPWRASVDRVKDVTRGKLGLDPTAQSGSDLSFALDKERLIAVDADVQRAPLKKLGIPPSLLGMKSEVTTFEAKIHFARSEKVDLSLDVKAHDLKLLKLPLLDAGVKMSASGVPSESLDVTRGEIAIGPLKGEVAGKVRALDDGLLVDIDWKGGPIPCSALAAAAKPAPAGSALDIGNQLGALAQNLGLAKVTGEIRATAKLIADTRDLKGARLELTPVESCKIESPLLP
jgi:hypothetical protein